MQRPTFRITAGIVPKLVAAAAVVVLTAGAAAACAICLSGFVVTLGQKLDSADQAVLALPNAETGQFRIIEVIKGGAARDGIITEPNLSEGLGQAGMLMTLDGPAGAQKQQRRSDGKPLLLLWNGIAEQWTSVGTIAVGDADWLRRLAATKHPKDGGAERSGPLAGLPSSDLTGEEWLERVALAAPYLESAEPVAAEIAYGEIARAPYRALRVLKGKLDARRLAAWIDDPKLAARQPAYTLLLGIAGGADDAARLEARIEKAWATHDATNLSAMLAADLELRGPQRVDWLQKMYLSDHDRSLPEINGALLALSIHGGAGGAIPRERVVEAYRSFIKERTPMAGFVAQDLADWEVWDATAAYMSILRSKAVKDPASEFMIVRYIQRSRDASAKQELEAYLKQSQ